MKAMVILNIGTEAELANGTRGTVLVSDLRENRTLPTDDPGMIPICPSVYKFSAKSGVKTFKIMRSDICLYKAQGQTMDYVIVDIAKHPSGRLSRFHVYVALSRNRGREELRILMDFDPSLFM